MKTAAKLLPYDPKITVRRAVDTYHGQARLAAALGTTRANVNSWVRARRRFLPPLWAYRLRELRPDLFWPADD